MAPEEHPPDPSSVPGNKQHPASASLDVRVRISYSMLCTAGSDSQLAICGQSSQCSHPLVKMKSTAGLVPRVSSVSKDPVNQISETVRLLVPNEFEDRGRH